MTCVVRGGRKIMKNKIVIKGIIIGIILLLVGATVIPASTNKNQNRTKDNTFAVKTVNDQIDNLIGGVIVTFDYAAKDSSVKFEWWKTIDRNFTYPIINGNVSVNYTIKLQAYAVGVYFIPRLLNMLSTLSYDVNTSRGSNWIKWKVVPFTLTTPGIEINLHVETTTPFPTPPSDPGKNTTMMWAYTAVSVFTFPPVRAGEETRPYLIHPSHKQINFTTSFYEI
jgi:hypothetical protein